MKFSEQWLREWVNPPISTAQLVAQLTNAGLEVNTVTPVAAAFTGVVIAEIMTTTAHPHAEHLQICQINVGHNELVTIVTNEMTLQIGMKVPVALVGASLSGVEIKPLKLRKIASFGMFCSAKTLGISEADGEILQLAKTALVGHDLRDYLQLHDQTIALELTPNRGDCLSIVGIAREVAVANESHFKGVAIKPIAAAIDERITLQINAPEACPRYASRIIRNLNPSACSPLWLQEKLRRSGLRSIHPVVDITNYVMLELGQPMHAFDLNVVGKKITVEYAGGSGTTTLLLNNETYTVQADTLSVKDAAGTIIALAGIMGAKHGSITATTTAIILESAFFTPLSLLGKARRYGIHTDSSHRFERGVDPHLTVQAIERATELLLAIVGGEPGPCVEHTSVAYLPTIKPILLRAASIQRLLGCTPTAAKINSILVALSMQVKTLPTAWEVTPPSFRFDIAIEADLIEEVARIYGYHNIPNQLPALPIIMLPQSSQQMPLSILRQSLKNRGYHEAITYSFVDSKLQELLDPHQYALPLINPISTELSVMRTSLWVSLLPVLIYNQKRQQSRVRLFEIGRRFVELAGQSQEILALAGLAWGPIIPEQWGVANRATDFYDVKNDLETLFAGVTFTFVASEQAALHWGQSAQINLHGEKVGYVGVLSPEIEQKLSLSAVYAFEIDLTATVQAALQRYAVVAKFPTVRRDIAILVSKQISAAEIYNEVVKLAGNLLNQCILFDIYTGKGVPVGQTSMALGLILQAPDRTLVEAEVKPLIETIITGLKQRFAATLREE